MQVPDGVLNQAAVNAASRDEHRETIRIARYFGVS
jgi:hypothetical protein